MILKINLIKFNKFFKSEQSGFTLIEILIVMVALVFLMGAGYQLLGVINRNTLKNINEQSLEENVNNFIMILSRDIRNADSSKNIFVTPNQLDIYDSPYDINKISYVFENNSILRNGKPILNKVNNVIVEPEIFNEMNNGKAIEVNIKIKSVDERAYSTTKSNSLTFQIARRNPKPTSSPPP
jgi:prepilin-type N-terminal cleavage/methylation domain-containing protein